MPYFAHVAEFPDHSRRFFRGNYYRQPLQTEAKKFENSLEKGVDKDLIFI
jgi:hypothetical protein